MANISPKTEFSIPQQVMSRLVDDQTVLLDLESGMYFGLDGVGKRIWERISAGDNLEEIAAVIAAEYDVDESRALADAIEFASELVTRGLLCR